MTLKGEVSIAPRQVVDVVSVTAKTMIEPIRSLWNWSGYHDKGIWGKSVRVAYAARHHDEPTLDDYFGVHPYRSVEIAGIQELQPFLENMSNKLVDAYGEPRDFLGKEESTKWQFFKQSITGLVQDSNLTILDYVGSARDVQLLFAQKDAHIHVLTLRPGEANIAASVTKQLASPKYSIPVLGESLVDMELGLERLVEVYSREEKSDCAVVLRKITSATNDFTYKRHALFEREGEFFTGLRHLGIHSLGEMQTTARVLFDKGWKVDMAGNILADARLLETWLKIRSLPYEHQLHAEKPTQSELAAEAQRYMQEQAYYRLILAKLDGSELVRQFLTSDIYKRYRDVFVDRHLAAIGATEKRIAGAMLAGVYLMAFEGVDDASQSPSQCHLAIPGYHRDLQQYIQNSIEEKPLIPDATSTETMAGRAHLISQLMQDMSIRELEKSHVLTLRVGQDEVAQVTTNAVVCMGDARGQMNRNPVHRKVIGMFHNLGILASEGEQSRVGMGEVFIGNAMLKTVDIDGAREFTYPWFQTASGYLGADRPHELPPLAEAETMDIDQVVRDIFSGEVTTEDHPYRAQESRIVQHAGTILAYLSNGSQVPLSVRRFMTILQSPQMRTKLIEGMGGISDNDPNLINRFFPEGLESFQRATIYRYVFDFVRGVESNLLIGVGKKRGGLAAVAAGVEMWAGNWRNHDYSRVDADTLKTAVRETLHDAHSRVLELNHAVGEMEKLIQALDLSPNEMADIQSLPHRRTWKTIQEQMEVMLGWDTTSMKFLRWQGFWSIWNTLGAAWDCICFTRKTIFNPKPLKVSF